MKYKLSFIIILVCLIFSSCISFEQNNTSNDLPAASLKPYGRYLFDEQQNLELISSAVHFGFSFTGKECTVYAFINDAKGHNYLQYELDGVYQKRMKVMGGSVQQIVLSANNNGTHTIEIYKATEATTGPIFIQKITGNNLHAVTPSNAP